jgi:hypothetical protein
LFPNQHAPSFVFYLANLVALQAWVLSLIVDIISLFSRDLPQDYRYFVLQPLFSLRKQHNIFAATAECFPSFVLAVMSCLFFFSFGKRHFRERRRQIKAHGASILFPWARAQLGCVLSVHQRDGGFVCFYDVVASRKLKRPWNPSMLLNCV